MDVIAQIKQIPILDVAKMLGIQIKRNKTMCFKGHDRKTPSLTFTPQKNLFYCFGCGIGGSNIDLVMQSTNMSSRDSISWLKEKFLINSPVNMPVSRYRSITINKKPLTQEPQNTVSPDPELYSTLLDKLTLSDRGRTYLNNRGFSDVTIREFGIKDITRPSAIASELIKTYSITRLGMAGLTRFTERNHGKEEHFIWWDYTILFPFFEDAKVIYIQGRRLSSYGPKYLGLRGIPKPVYNLSTIKNMKKNDLLLICEGIPDVLAAYEMGYSAIGILGAHSFKEQWVNSLLPFDLIIIPDNDVAGTGFGKKIRKLFLDHGKIVQIVRMENVKDLSELHQQKNTR